jgi:3-phenylpropionate/trans-cinnamate dioxygenase ferredoxin component
VAAEKLVTVASVDEIPPGGLKHIEAGGEEIALANVDGEVYAVQGQCLHLKGPLAEGQLEEACLTCPWHGWRYDVRTGLNDFDHAIRLRTYEVRVEDGEVKVAV